MDQEQKLLDLVNPHLNAIIESIKNNSLFAPSPSSDSIQKLYQSTAQTIQDLQTNLNNCKKYNEAKIHRKYEIIISDLRAQNSYLADKVKLETEARPEHHKYISGLLDKMINIKNNNEHLDAENSKLRAALHKYEDIGGKIGDKEDQEDPQKMELVRVHNQMEQIHKAATSFLASKTNSLCKTPFTNFVKNNIHKFERLTLESLLDRIDLWSMHHQDIHAINKSKIKRKLEHSQLKLNKNMNASFQGNFNLPQLTPEMRLKRQQNMTNKNYINCKFKSERKFNLYA